jgi:hypothetical protein
MATAFAEIAVGLSRNSSLGFGYRLNDDLRLSDEIVEAAAGDRITARVNDERCFNEVGGDTRRIALLSIADAQALASGSSRRMAISADVSTIIEVSRVDRKAGRHSRRIEAAP